MKAKSGSSLERQILFGCALVALVGLVAASDTFHTRSAELIAACEAVIADFPVIGMLLFCAFSAASAMLAFFSSALLVPVGIEAWGMPACFFLLWASWFIGGLMSFGVGWYFGRAIVERIVGVDRLQRIDRRVGRRTRFVHIVLFQAMLPSEIPGYVLGSIRYRLGPYALALAIAELPYALATVYIGESFLEQRSGPLIVLAASAALLAAAGFAAYRRRSLTARLPLPFSRDGNRARCSGPRQ